MNETRTEQEFDIRLLFKVLIKFWYIILAATVLLGAVVGGYKAATAKPTYVARIFFWVEGSANNMAASQMAAGYVELINSGPQELWDRANTHQSDDSESNQDLNEKWGLSISDTYSLLHSMVSAYRSDEESNMFTLSVSSSSKEMTYDAVSSLQYVTESVLEKISGVSNVKRTSEIFDLSDVIVRSDSKLKYAAIGALSGFAVSYALCLWLYINRKRIDGIEMLKAAEIAPIVSVIPTSPTELSGERAEPSSEIPFETRESFNFLRAALTTDRGEGVYVLMPASESHSSAFITAGLALSFAESGHRVAAVGAVGTGIEVQGLTNKTVELKDGYISGSDIAAAVAECKKDAGYVLVSLPSHSRVEDITAVSRVSDGFILTVGVGDRIDFVKKAVERIEGAKGNTVGICYTEK